MIKILKTIRKLISLWRKESNFSNLYGRNLLTIFDKFLNNHALLLMFYYIDNQDFDIGFLKKCKLISCNTHINTVTNFNVAFNVGTL